MAFEAGYTFDDVEMEFAGMDEAIAFYRRAATLALELRSRSR